jgi:hypothetical protein
MNEAREIVNKFLSSPFGVNPTQAKYFAGILIESHIYSNNDGKFATPEDFKRNNEKWLAIRKSLEKV